MTNEPIVIASPATAPAPMAPVVLLAVAAIAVHVLLQIALAMLARGSALMPVGAYAAHALVFCTATLLGLRLLGERWRALDLVRMPLTLATVLMLVGLSVALRLVVGAVFAAVAGLGFDVTNPQVPWLSKQLATRDAMLVTFVAAGIALPMVEELFFRGVLYRGLRPHGVARAALLSALFFAVAHFNWAVGFAAFLLGLLAAYVYERKRTLWAPIVLHVAFNSLSLALLFLLMRYAPDTLRRLSA